ncbi:MAG: hypothetical protein M3Q26_02665 [Acidobacteriota bacterium]|nr:hypothetical protein [Acidobacteriota bacterium]
MTRMAIKFYLPLIFGLIAVFFALGSDVSGQSAGQMDKVDKATVDRIIAGWKATPMEVARTIMAKYGMPNEATTMRLVWHNNGPWKMTELVNEEIPHSFPKQHPDMLRQTISYQVPTGKFDELAEYDGSVIVERTKGEISARCDKEEANFLALNLADDIVKGKKSVKGAREFYSETVLQMKNPEYTRGFLFSVSNSTQGDADRPLMTNGKALKTNE